MDNITLISLDSNGTASSAEAMSPLYGSSPGNSIENGIQFMDDSRELHTYLRITCLVFLFLIFTVGTIGNVMVTMVISCSRDMRTSTNIFLVNLSIADLLVLVICTPTALIEVTHHPDRWVLGFYLCKFIPLLENTVANASVLTILAISFERYYAICRPLRANYVCTKSRAVCISIAAWVLASFITSPMILMIKYEEGVNEHQEWTARCDVQAGSFWPDTYTITTIILFFLLPFFILLVTYGMIANRLTMDRSMLNAKNENHKARKQVVTMLGTVVFTFFLCLIPFRVLTLFVILADTTALNNHAEAYHNFVYFSRIMVYLNSCLNPILYNVMSSKFRNGFLRLCYRQKKPSPFTRNGTFLTNTTTNSTNMSINLGHQPGLAISCNGKGSGQNSPELNGSLLKRNGVTKIDGKTLKNYLLSQSHSHSPNNGFLLNTHRSPPTLYNGVGVGANHHSYYPFQETPTCSAAFRNPSIKMHHIQSAANGISSKGTNNNYNNSSFSGQSTVKSDLVYSAYIPGRRSETVL